MQDGNCDTLLYKIKQYKDMNTCRETFLDDIVAVWPLAVGVLTHSVPETVVSDIVDVTTMGDGQGNFSGLSDLRALLSTHYRFSESEDEGYTFLLQEAPTLKIVTERSVSGYQYTITMGMKTLYYGEEEKEAIRMMEWTGCDYVLERQDGSLCLLRYFAPAQKFTHEHSGDGANLTMAMRNVTGLQRIVEDESEE